MTIRPSTALKAGFTLIELSIVLVIIGLIVGGVLVGQDLIRAAEIRATVGQVEKYNSAVNTFRTKYNGIPGDILASQATAFGICTTTICTGGTGVGDGNGLIQDATAANLPPGEPLIFWYELSNANLVDGSLGQGLQAAGALPASFTTPQVIPPAKMGRGNYWMVGSTNGTNYYMLGGATPVAGGWGFSATLTPIESYNIDVKLDDGTPNTGIVQARNPGNATSFADLSTATVNAAGTVTATAANQACEFQGSMGGGTDPTSTYKRDTVSGNTPNCILRFRFN